MAARPIPNEKKRECIRLRLEQDLPAKQISKLTKVGLNTVERVLKNYPLKERRRGYGGGKRWTLDEHATLKRLYPTAEQNQILKEMPGRTWHSVVQRAVRLKIHRPNRATRIANVHPLIAQLRAMREQRGITRNQLANLMGYSPSALGHWELGQTGLTFVNLLDWANALGCDLTLELHSVCQVIPFEKAKHYGKA